MLPTHSWMGPAPAIVNHTPKPLLALWEDTVSLPSTSSGMQTVFAGQCVGLTSIQHTTIGKNPCRITLRESNISLRGDAPTLLLERAG